MNIDIITGNLLDYPGYIAHCISADFALGAGIAKQINARYNTRAKLLTKYKGFEYKPCCLQAGHVFNLVTKPVYWAKPNYITMRGALEDLRDQLLKQSITEIAMPYIGCGFDRLDWPMVLSMICIIFQNTDISIKIYSLEANK